MNAHEWLQHAGGLIRQRGKERDKPDGERTFGQAAAIYTATTGRGCTGADVALVLVAVKLARGPDADSLADLIAYAALYAEATGVEPSWLPDDPDQQFGAHE
jgi:hypothetical protein